MCGWKPQLCGQGAYVCSVLCWVSSPNDLLLGASRAGDPARPRVEHRLLTSAQQHSFLGPEGRPGSFPNPKPFTLHGLVPTKNPTALTRSKQSQSKTSFL